MQQSKHRFCSALHLLRPWTCLSATSGSVCLMSAARSFHFWRRQPRTWHIWPVLAAESFGLCGVDIAGSRKWILISIILTGYCFWQFCLCNWLYLLDVYCNFQLYKKQHFLVWDLVCFFLLHCRIQDLPGLCPKERRCPGCMIRLFLFLLCRWQGLPLSECIGCWKCLELTLRFWTRWGSLGTMLILLPLLAWKLMGRSLWTELAPCSRSSLAGGRRLVHALPFCIVDLIITSSNIIIIPQK